MPAAEIPFEYLALALETTKGTAITTPTHFFPFAGTLTPSRTTYRAMENNGLLAKNSRSKRIRADATWQGDGGADVNYAPVLFNLFVKDVSAPTTPTNGVLTRLWTFSPTMNADNLKSATVFFGDPNVQIFRSAYCMGDTLTISADASGEDAATWSMNGFGRFPSRVSAPSLPAQNVGSLLIPGAMQLWIDVASAIGTTEVTGRFISTEWTIPAGATRKHYAGGPTLPLDFTKHGRTKRSAKARITVELNDLSVGSNAEYQRWEADSVVKMRIRINGSLIESVSPDYYEYLQLDIYGPLDAFAWGAVEESNRTMTFEVESEYNSTAGADFVLYAQNTKTTL